MNKEKIQQLAGENARLHFSPWYNEYAYTACVISFIAGMEQDRWISVDEELPPFDERVIVYGHRMNYAPMGNPYEITVGRRQDLRNTSLSKLSERYQDRNQFSQFVDVTHWQPLPSAPNKQ